MKIYTIGKDSVPVSIMDISPTNKLIHRKAASFGQLVRTVFTRKGFITSSKLIQFISHQISVDSRYALLEAQSVSNSF